MRHKSEQQILLQWHSRSQGVSGNQESIRGYCFVG